LATTTTLPAQGRWTTSSTTAHERQQKSDETRTEPELEAELVPDPMITVPPAGLTTGAAICATMRDEKLQEHRIRHGAQC
jgi:hypothetical protein